LSNCQAIVVPLYKAELTPTEQFSLERTLSLLYDHDIFLVGPLRLETYFLRLSERYGSKLKIKLFADIFFENIAGYNKLLMSERFYAPFETYPYMLLVQTDALVLKDELSTWCELGYSYIGAPMFKGFTAPREPLELFCVGNGGFSLRKIADFLRVLRRPHFFRNKLMEDWQGTWISNWYRYMKDYWSFSYLNTQLNIWINEDIFWGLFVPARCDFFRVPGLDIACKFAFETAVEQLYARNNRQIPFGCHAWERYDRDRWISIFETHQIQFK